MKLMWISTLNFKYVLEDNEYVENMEQYKNLALYEIPLLLGIL